MVKIATLVPRQKVEKIGGFCFSMVCGRVISPIGDKLGIFVCFGRPMSPSAVFETLGFELRELL